VAGMGQSPPPSVLDLVARFERNLDAYRSPAYNETQLRQEFINPLFEALGWDVANKAGHAEAYKDLIQEDAIKIGGTTKAPDYCFRIGGAQIDATDNEIDQLVYALYGLTQDEIVTVEGRRENQPHGDLDRPTVGPGEDPGQA